VKTIKLARNCITSPAKGSVELAQNFVDNSTTDSLNGFGSLHTLQVYVMVVAGAVLHGIIGNTKERRDMATAIIKLLFKIFNIFFDFILFDIA